MQTIEPDILIVGGGVAGSALACALRNRGYSIVMVDQRKAPLDTARGDHFQPCNVEALAKWGVLDKIFEAGAGKRIGHEFRMSDGEVLLQAEYTEIPIPYPYFVVFHHDLIAEFFLECAKENADFQFFQPVSAKDFEADENGIKSLKINFNDEEIVIKPKIVVAADGTNSVVRPTLKFATFEHPYRHPMVAVFGKRPTNLKPDDYFFRYSGKSGVLVVQQRMDDEVKVTLPVGEEGIPWWKSSTKEQRAEFLGVRAEIFKDFDSEIAGFYPVRMIHAIDYAIGNTVLIGDAAHSIHPARGQGLNMGIASLPRLIDCLPKPSEIADIEKVKSCLQTYQFQQKPLYDRIIARNHQAAMEMEMGAEDNAEKFIYRQNEQIRQIHKQADLRHLHLLEATGYPFGIPSETEPDYQA